MTYIVKITGDENDGDYVSTEYEYNGMYNILLKEDELFKGCKQLTVMDFLIHLRNALEKTSRENEKSWDKHNWCRCEYDFYRNYDFDTSYNLAISLDLDEGLSLSDNDADIDHFDSCIDSVKEFLAEYLWIGEYGVHTVTNIEYYKKPEIVELMK